MKNLFCGIFLLGLCACSSGLPTTMLASTSPIPAGIRGTIPTSGSSCQYFLLGLIPMSFAPDTQDTLEDAKVSADVDVLTDVTVDHGGGYYILFSNLCSRVRGKGVPREVLERATTKQ
jgi:hypothetical protein